MRCARCACSVGSHCRQKSFPYHQTPLSTTGNKPGHLPLLNKAGWTVCTSKPSTSVSSTLIGTKTTVPAGSGGKTHRNRQPVRQPCSDHPTFITNECIRRIGDSQITGLANRIYSLTQDMLNSYGFNQVSEIQFDCDWTAATKRNLF